MLFQVVFFFERTIEEDSIDSTYDSNVASNGASCPRSKTTNMITSSKENGAPARLAQRDSYPGRLNNNSSAGQQALNKQMANVAVTDSSDVWRHRNYSEPNTQVLVESGKSKSLPHNPHSVPQFTANQRPQEPQLLDVQRRKNPSQGRGRGGKLSPAGDRRGLLPTVQSDNSLFDAASTGEGEVENFSDSDTDDEWEGCDVTAV